MIDFSFNFEVMTFFFYKSRIHIMASSEPERRSSRCPAASGLYKS
jgi:hypothetical protein